MSEKLQKVLAARGMGSRREMERWIGDGRITVNGRKADLGDRVTAGDRILVDGKLLAGPAAAAPRSRVILYNKPEGEITSRADPEGRPTVFRHLPRLQGQRWIAVGRLDYNTSGLILFTTDGELANRLMHPSTAIEREYLCRVMGEVEPEQVEALLRGVQLEDGPARFTNISARGGKGINRWFLVTLAEGRNREVRRLWEALGHQVSRLKRVRFGPVQLPAFVRPGDWLELDRGVLVELYRQAGLKPPPPVPLNADELARRRRQEQRLRRRGQGRRLAPN